MRSIGGYAMLSPQLSMLSLHLWSQMWYRFGEDKCKIMSKFILDEGLIFNFCVYRSFIVHLAKHSKVSQDLISIIEILKI